MERAPRLLQTPRLSLTVPAAADADAIFERYASDPDVTRYVGWPRHKSLADTQGFVAFSSCGMGAFAGRPVPDSLTLRRPSAGRHRPGVR